MEDIELVWFGRDEEVGILLAKDSSSIPVEVFSEVLKHARERDAEATVLMLYPAEARNLAERLTVAADRVEGEAA
jgi:hypothetical protein